MSRLRKIGAERDLILIDVLTLILILLITCLSVTWLRIVLGLPFLLFSPGYTLVAALFPRKEGLGGIERLTLSFGISIVVVSLIGLILNYTPWGIDLYPILLSVSFFVLVMSTLAWYKRRIYAPGDRFSVSFLYRQQLPGLKWQEMAGWDRVLSIVLVISILGTIGTLGYVIATPKVGEKFTEFYILGDKGTAANYPKELVVGEEGNVILGIVNREQETVNYQVEAWIEEEQVNIWLGEGELEQITLPHKGVWENSIGFVMHDTSLTTLSAPATEGQMTLVVEETDKFDVDDYIRIGSADEKKVEIVQIESIDADKSEITIKAKPEYDHDEEETEEETNVGLKYDHDEGEMVIKIQKIEFRLFKDVDSEPCKPLYVYVDILPA